MANAFNTDHDGDDGDDGVDCDDDDDLIWWLHDLLLSGLDSDFL